MGTLAPGPSQCLPGEESPEASSLDLGVWTYLYFPKATPPILRVWLGLELVSWAFLYLPTELLSFGQLLSLRTLSLLPCPALMQAQPVLVIVCSACLQPLYSSAPPLACKVCFLIAAPTTHLGFARSPSSSSLPPSLGVGLKKKANLTAALLS